MKQLIIILSLSSILVNLSAQRQQINPTLVAIIDASRDTSVIAVENKNYTYAYTVAYSGLNASDAYVKVMHSIFRDSLYTLREYNPTDSLQLDNSPFQKDFLGVSSYKDYVKYVYNKGSNTAGSVRIYRRLKENE